MLGHFFWGNNMKHLLIGVLLVLASSAFALEHENDNPQYQDDTKVWLLAQENCAAAQKNQQDYALAMSSSLFSCAGLNFDAQQPRQPLAQLLYARYCVKAAGSL